VHLGLEGIHLILHQVRVALRSMQLQLSPQLQKMQQGDNQCRPGTSMDPVSSCGINVVLEQLRRLGQ
jgi:hypothetical protein